MDKDVPVFSPSLARGRPERKKEGKKKDSGTSPMLPKVDFSVGDLQPGSHNWNQVRSQVQHALETYGCFEAIFPEIPLQLRNELLRVTHEFFELPVETKSLSGPGYTASAPWAPSRESMSIGDTNNDEENLKRVTNLLWPDGDSNFSETMISFTKRATVLNHMVKRMVVESLGLDKYYDSHIDSTEFLLQIKKYKMNQTKEPLPGFSEHTDFNVLTILFPYQAGLEVQTKGGDWILVPGLPDTCVVLAADCFMAWTNGRIYAPLHRVTLKGTEDRYCITFFDKPKAGCIIQAPEEVVDEKHPLLFKPFVFEDYKDFCFSCFSEGHYAESTLTTYCGF